MKLPSNKILLMLLLLISGTLYIVGCTHKDEPVPASVSTGVKTNHGSHVHLPGMTAGDTSQWKLDAVHSNVMWSTPFDAVGAPLTGRFNSFGVANITADKMINYVTTGQALPDTSWAFYENQPAKTHFAGYVQINTSNTGQPARDGGCFLNTMGTTAIVAGTQNLTATNIAYIQSTSVAFDPSSNSYLATFNLTWKGQMSAPHTESIVGKLTYVPETAVSTAESYFGLELQFQFNCRDFGITATDIADVITVDMNLNFNNK